VLNVGYVAIFFYDLLPKTLASSSRAYPPIAVNLLDMIVGINPRAPATRRIISVLSVWREAAGEAGCEVFRSIPLLQDRRRVAKNMGLAKQR